MTPLGDLPGGDFGTAIYGVSGDGRVAVGYSYSDRSVLVEAVRWTPEGGLAPLDDFFPGGNFYSIAQDVSFDGSVIIGWADSPKGAHEAFRWTEAEGMVGLGDLPGGSYSSHADAVSADGRVITGTSSGNNIYSDLFVWTAETGMVSLYSPDMEDADPYGISGDGAVIVGDVLYRGRDGEAFIWGAERGMRLLRDELLYYYGLDIGAWSLHRANGVSDDGRTIVGYGTNPDGFREGWVVYLGDPPLCSPQHDLDRDGRVTLGDLALLLANYGLEPATLADGDFDADGVVDLDDVADFLGDFLEPC
jgi:probable HAF family extracellular repeat protein